MTSQVATGWRVWLLAARPRTLGASIAPVLMGTAMAYSDGGFHVPTALATLLCAILIQIEANYANDYFDFLKGADTENKQPAEIRETVSLRRNLLTILEETRPVGASGDFAFRHRYVFTRAETPTVTPSPQN